MLNKPSRWKRTAVIISVNAALICIAIAAVEVFCRIYHIVNIQWVEGDGKVGFHIAPDCSLRVDFPEHAGGYYVYRSNNLGFREDRATEVATRDSVRIVVLGDSHTDGACWNSQSYPHRLEHYLNQRNPCCPAEVINAGNGRYSPFQYLRAYQYRVKPLHPDIVIIGFYIGNDFFDIFRRDDRPSLRIEKDGRVTELPPEYFFYSRPGFLSSPLAKSYVYYILFGGRWWKGLSYTVSRSFVFFRNARSIDNVSTGDLLAYFHDLYRLTKLNRHATTQSLVQFSFFHYFPEKIDESMKLVEYTLARFQDEQAARPFRLILVPIPSRFQIEGNTLQAFKSRVEKKCRYISSAQPETLENALFDSLARMAAGMKMEIIDLRSAMYAKAGEGKLYFNRDFHINPAAHDIIGHEIAAYLDSTGYTQAGRMSEARCPVPAPERK